MKDFKNGRKLNKKELRTVSGGLMRCLNLDTRRCTTTGVACAEPECRYVPDPLYP